MPNRAACIASLTVAALLAACTVPSADPATGTTQSSLSTVAHGRQGGAPPPSSNLLRESPPLNLAWANATHNSYWVNRDTVVEAEASGVQERIVDQAAFEHVRWFEFDIHQDATPGNFSVLHTDRPQNSLCATLAECLKQLQIFHHAVPEHDPIVVMLEFKDIYGRVLNDTTHTPAALDAVLEAELGPQLYRPAAFLSRCTPGATMRQCAEDKAWPTLQELRGKFLVAVMGNWGAVAGVEWGKDGLDWVQYATSGVETRSAFPMESPFAVDLLTGKDHVSCATLQAAQEASPFAQVQVGEPDMRAGTPSPLPPAPACKGTPWRNLLARNVIVRAGFNYPQNPNTTGASDTYRLDHQKDGIGVGFTFVQTDHPWYVFDDGGPARPYRVRPGIEASYVPQVEVGERIAFLRQPSGARGELDVSAPPSTEARLETLVALTRPATNGVYPTARNARGKGCLAARATGGDAVRVCRTTVDGERATITVEVTHAGVEHQDVVTSADHHAGDYGELLRLDVNGACATAYSAGHIEAGEPAWKAIGGAHCALGPLTAHALEAEAGDALFVGTKRASRAHGGAWESASVALDSARVSGGYTIVDPADSAAVALFRAHATADVETYDRGPGRVPTTCTATQDLDAGLCYPKCNAGYVGVGPVCWGSCPAGFATDPLTCRRDADIYAKPSYGRGVGTPPTSCAAGEEYDAGLCYAGCAAGYHGVGPVCWGTCPPDYNDDGATCRRDANIFGSDNSQCPWYDKCGLTLSKGCSKCPAGYANDGCTCRRDVSIFGKPSYGRGVGHVPNACASGQSLDAGLCYGACAAGYHGVGPVCWGTCAPDHHDDGGTCRRDAIITSRPSYGRSVGAVPVCGGDDYDAGLCYARCDSAFARHPQLVTSCRATCPGGYVAAAGATCAPL